MEGEGWIFSLKISSVEVTPNQKSEPATNKQNSDNQGEENFPGKRRKVGREGRKPRIAEGRDRMENGVEESGPEGESRIERKEKEEGTNSFKEKNDLKDIKKETTNISEG
jgi:hypothetical protein